MRRRRDFHPNGFTNRKVFEPGCPYGQRLDKPPDNLIVQRRRCRFLFGIFSIVELLNGFIDEEVGKFTDFSVRNAEFYHSFEKISFGLSKVIAAFLSNNSILRIFIGRSEILPFSQGFTASRICSGFKEVLWGRISTA